MFLASYMMWALINGRKGTVAVPEPFLGIKQLADGTSPVVEYVTDL